MAILILAEHDNKHLSEHTARTLTAGSKFGTPVDIVVGGHQCRPAAEAAAMIAGVRQVLVADDPAYAHQSPEALAGLLVGLARDYEAVLAPATAAGKSVLPRVAALLDVMQISNVTEVVAPDTFRHPIYAGNAVETLRSADAIKVLTIRTTSFAPTTNGGSASIQEISSDATPVATRVVSETLSRTDRPALQAARIVVAGGRAFGSREQFEALLGPLAERLGAAIGASRAAVDAGYAPNDLQVGQTGQMVAPELYIACGISGAIQHIAGMKDSKVVVAINNDPDAPIFQIADYGLVGDIFSLVPELTAKL